MFANNRNRYFYKRLKIRSWSENWCFVELWPTISIRREFDAGRVNLDPPMTCADWPVPGNLTLLHTQTAYTRKPWHRYAKHVCIIQAYSLQLRHVFLLFFWKSWIYLWIGKIQCTNKWYTLTLLALLSAEAPCCIELRQVHSVQCGCSTITNMWLAKIFGWTNCQLCQSRLMFILCKDERIRNDIVRQQQPATSFASMPWSFSTTNQNAGFVCNNKGSAYLFVTKYWMNTCTLFTPRPGSTVCEAWRASTRHIG